MARKRRELAIAGALIVLSLGWAASSPPSADAAPAAALSVDAATSTPPDAATSTPPIEEDGVRTRLASLEALYRDGGARTASAPPSLARVRAMIERADAYGAARRTDEARLAESIARTWLEVTEHSIALQRDRVREGELDAGAARAKAILASHAQSIATLEARRAALTQALGDREAQLARPRETGVKR